MTPNETETLELVGFRPTNRAEALHAAAKLREKGVEIAIIKLGAAGVGWVSAESSGFVPAFSVNAIDSVAAGDSFNGGLAVALSEGVPLSDAVRFAAAAGALATTKNGATTAMPYRAEVAALLQAQPQG
jgi:ribokinase